MATREELDVEARSLGINPDEFSRKGELAAAIDDVKAAQSSDDPPSDNPPADEPGAPDTNDVPQLDADDAKKGTVLTPLTYKGGIIEVGEKVPSGLSDEDLEVLVRQGHVAG